MAGIAVKISLPLNRAVILTRSLVKGNANPFSLSKGCWTSEADHSSPTIIELDYLAHPEVVCHDQCGGMTAAQ